MRFSQKALDKFTDNTKERKEKVMNMKRLRVGDVVRSSLFAYGIWEEDGETRFIKVGPGHKKKSYSYDEQIPEAERVKMAAETGKIPPKTRKVEMSAYEKTRGTANFVVETVVPDTDATHGTTRVHVVARRLNGVSYDVAGEEIHLNTEDANCIDNMEVGTHFKVIGHMRHAFEWS